MERTTGLLNTCVVLKGKEEGNLKALASQHG